MKILHYARNTLITAYFAGYFVKRLVSAVVRDNFYNYTDDFLRRYPELNVGDLVSTGCFEVSPASQVLFSAATAAVAPETVGWIIEKFVDPERPGSIVWYRVLFPTGPLWISQSWVIKI